MVVPALSVRPARPADAEAIAAIFAQGVEERVATFETRVPAAQDWQRRPPRRSSSWSPRTRAIERLLGDAADGQPPEPVR